MTIFLDNPRKKKRARKATRKRARKATRKRARFKKGSAAAKAYMASIRPGAKRKRKRATTKKRRRARRSTTEAPKMARRKRSTRARKRATSRKRGRRRSYRRNPPLMRQVMQGVADGAAVTAGKAATRIVAGKLPMLPKNGPLGLVAQMGVAAVVGYLSKYAPASARPFVRAGAFGSVIEDAVVGLKVPLLSASLDAYPLDAYPLNAYPSLAALPAGGERLMTDLPAFAGGYNGYNDYGSN